jgi:membrane associated rhomboid family serine protease
MTPWVTRLIAANALMFLVQVIRPPLTVQLLLIPALIPQRPWTALTYMFLHGGLAHLFFNMLGLYFFGPALERRLGSRHFIQLYLAAGLAGALLSTATPYAPIVGASGAIFGVLLGFAWFWPRERIYLWGIIAVEARWLVLVMTALSLFGGATGARDGVAHFAHLGGFAGGYLYLRWMEHHSPLAKWRRKITPPPRRAAAPDVERWRRIDPEALHPVNREELERVMAKVNADGPVALTPGERQFLDRFSPPA